MDIVLQFQVSGCGVEREHFSDIEKARKKLSEKLQWRWHYTKRPTILETFKKAINNQTN